MYNVVVPCCIGVLNCAEILTVVILAITLFAYSKCHTEVREMVNYSELPTFGCLKNEMPYDLMAIS